MTEVTFSTTGADLDSKEVSLKVLPSCPPSSRAGQAASSFLPSHSVYQASLLGKSKHGKWSGPGFHHVCGHEMQSTYALQSWSPEVLADLTI